MAAELLEDGWNLVIFPEGGRSPDGWTQAFRGGAAYLARRTGAPVVPVYLHGTRHVLPKSAGRPADRRGLGHRGPGRARPAARRGHRRLRAAPVAAPKGRTPGASAPGSRGGGPAGRRGGHRLVDRPAPVGDRAGPVGPRS